MVNIDNVLIKWLDIVIIQMYAWINTQEWIRKFVTWKFIWEGKFEEPSNFGVANFDEWILYWTNQWWFNSRNKLPVAKIIVENDSWEPSINSAPSAVNRLTMSLTNVFFGNELSYFACASFVSFSQFLFESVTLLVSFDRRFTKSVPLKPLPTTSTFSPIAPIRE